MPSRTTPDYSRQYYEDNKDRIAAYARDYARKNPEVNRRAQMKYRYGITWEQYEDLLLKQGFACAICRSVRPGGRGKRLHVDHDHGTGKVRGLLCWRCNSVIGRMNDSPTLLRCAAAYLERE